jgi:hypothetical protein
LQAFADAWSDACALDSAVLMIPQNRTYLLSPLELKGPCGSKFTVEVTKVLLPTILHNVDFVTLKIEKLDLVFLGTKIGDL